MPEQDCADCDDAGDSKDAKERATLEWIKLLQEPPISLYNSSYDHPQHSYDSNYSSNCLHQRPQQRSSSSNIKKHAAQAHQDYNNSNQYTDSPCAHNMFHLSVIEGRKH